MLVARSQGGNGKDGKARQGTNIYALLIVCKFVRKLFVALKPLDGVVTLLFPEFDTFRTLNKALFKAIVPSIAVGDRAPASKP